MIRQCQQLSSNLLVYLQRLSDSLHCDKTGYVGVTFRDDQFLCMLRRIAATTHALLNSVENCVACPLASKRRLTLGWHSRKRGAGWLLRKGGKNTIRRTVAFCTCNANYVAVTSRPKNGDTPTHTHSKWLWMRTLMICI